MLNIDNLNLKIKDTQLSLLDKDGFSCTIVDNCPFYLYALKDGLLMYYLAQSLNDSDMHNSELLVKILSLNAPSNKYPSLRLGLDNKQKILWISTFKREAELAGDNFADIYRDFIENAVTLKNELISILAASSQDKATEDNQEILSDEDLLASFKGNLLSI